MTRRYEDAPAQYYTLVQDIIGRSFTHLNNAIIEIVLDTKKTTTGGKYVICKLKKSTVLTRHLSATTDAPDGVDYFLYLDKLTFDTIEEADKIRVVRFALQHAEVDHTKTNPYNERSPEITDFYEEITYNQDDLRWSERVNAIADALYNNDGETGVVEA